MIDPHHSASAYAEAIQREADADPVPLQPYEELGEVTRLALMAGILGSVVGTLFGLGLARVLS